MISDALAFLLDDPDLRLRLAFGAPRLHCDLCGGIANAVWTVKFDTDDVFDKEGNVKVEGLTWHEYHLGCATCYMHHQAKGLRPQRALPLRDMFVRSVKAKGGWTLIRVPVAFKRTSIGLILDISSLQSAPAVVQQLIHSENLANA